MQDDLKLQFEQIFTKHYERLTGASRPPGGLPFTLENMVCFILFGGRELDIEDIYGDVSERYSIDTFLDDAREAGIETDEKLVKTVGDLVAQKFLHLQPDGCYYSYQSTRETARMLNRIYPKMQGINVLAYIGQTFQELESGRIDLDTALDRFDQTLQKQGVPLPKPKIPVIAPQQKSASQNKKAEELKPGSPRIIRDYVVSDSAVKAKIEKSAVREETAEPPVRETADEDAWTPPPVAAGGKEEDADLLSSLSRPENKSVVNDPLPAEPPQKVANDDEIAARIAAFENQLSLICPICKDHTLKEEKTAAGKLFYSCTSAACNFISWGRPHLMACPRCKNSFMVEVADNAGQKFLKCPRATCQHRQPLTPASGGPPPAAPSAGPATGVKTVVRKRLVRRKV